MNEKDLSAIVINADLLRRLLILNQDQIDELTAAGVLVRLAGGEWDMYKSVRGYANAFRPQTSGNTDGKTDGDYIVSGDELRAALGGLTSQRLGQLAKLGITEKAARGQWKLLASVRGYIEYRDSQNTIEDDENDPRAATVRLKNEQALAMALQNALQMKQQLLADDVLRALERVQAIYNNSIDALEGRLTGQLVSATGVKSDVLLAVLKPELNSVRESVSRELAAYADELDGGEKKPGLVAV